jgi:hypothetical protein
MAAAGPPDVKRLISRRGLPVTMHDEPPRQPPGVLQDIHFAIWCNFAGTSGTPPLAFRHLSFSATSDQESLRHAHNLRGREEP